MNTSLHTFQTGGVPLASVSISAGDEIYVDFSEPLDCRQPFAFWWLGLQADGLANRTFSQQTGVVRRGMVRGMRSWLLVGIRVHA